MKYFLSLFLSTIFFQTVTAQEKHFIFIESDNKQPFYTTVNGKLYSSTASGYVIISKLAEGEYNLSIGFAGNTIPEQIFKYNIGQKDAGFLLKNFGDKGWGLFNLQTLAVTMAAETKALTVSSTEKPAEEYKPEISFERKKDTLVKVAPKTDLMVKADTSTTAQVKFTDSTSPPSTNTSASMAQVQSTPAASVNPSPEKSAEQNAPPAAMSSHFVSNSIVKKVDEVKGSMGVYLTYIDYNDKTKDTIQLIIPTNNKKAAKENLNVANASSEGSLNKKREDDLKFLNMDITTSKKDSIAITTGIAEESASIITNINCTALASENDYNKLRKKMALQATDETKISEARKVFKNKCFTTNQIQGLSTLFPSDEGRYKFFDVSYNFVSDVQSYSSLEKEFIDPYYLNRFKAMLRK